MAEKKKPVLSRRIANENRTRKNSIIIKDGKWRKDGKVQFK